MAYHYVSPSALGKFRKCQGRRIDPSTRKKISQALLGRRRTMVSRQKQYRKLSIT